MELGRWDLAAGLEMGGGQSARDELVGIMVFDLEDQDHFFDLDF